MQMTSKFEKVPIDKLVPYARNARTHSKEQIMQLRSSIREFGFLNPCLIDKDYNVIAGHGRILAAKEEGLTELPCVFVEHLTDAQKRAYIIADNRLAMNAGWDEEMLSVELSDLEGADFDLDLLGFTDSELKKLLGGLETEEDDFDLTAALEEASFVQPGDLWTVGRHRLICGDATKPEDVEKLMDGKKANLILTDPPYAVSYKSASGLSIQNDNLKPEEFYNFLLSSFKNMVNACEPGASAYVFHADTEGLAFRKAFEEAGFHLSGVCIWAKDSLVLGRSPYQWSHEPILFGWTKKGKHRWYAGRAETTVWHFDKPKRNENHPTSKPIDLLSYPIQNSSQTNAIVLDLFGGSGSTLIACEQTDRICYMAELDDKYASVILRRYVEYKNGVSDDVFVLRDGRKIAYDKLVKTVT
ncbi:MAG: site-specific DNA-methyltransferase [Saccharofermentanales bacterium]|jgi:DNA modification methylase